MSRKKPIQKSGPTLSDVCFYFDGAERDRLDSAGLSRRSAELLALRQQLQRLPEEQFDAVILTIRALVEESSRQAGLSPAPDAAAGRGDKGKRAKTLYDATRDPSARTASGSGATLGAGKVTAAR